MVVPITGEREEGGERERQREKERERKIITNFLVSDQTSPSAAAIPEAQPKLAQL